MKKRIVKLGDEILNTKAKLVKNVNDAKIATVIQDLKDTFAESNEYTVGISAPQIGYNHAISLCKDTSVDKTYILINPKVVWKSNETIVNVEGCKSVGKGEDGAGTILGKVERARGVEIEYLDEEGKAQKLKASGFFAAVIQHEIDHLEGRLFIHYIDDPMKLVKREDMKKGENYLF